MTVITRGFVLAAAIALATLLPSAASQAQPYPSKPITVMCGFAAGGGGDLICRYYAEKLSPVAGQRVTVENKVGALGAIAFQSTAQAKPDGYTLIVGPGSANSGHAAQFKKPLYDPVKDFTLVTTLTRLAFILVVNPQKTPDIKSVADVTAWSKASKTPLKTGGSTTTAAISSEWYRTLIGVEIIQTPYRSAQVAATDLLAGELDYVFMDPGLAAGHLEAGRLRALAVTSKVRASALPDVPTMAESGFPDFDVGGWWALYGPAGLPADIVAKLQQMMDPIVLSEETKKFFAVSVIDPFPRGNLDLPKFAESEVEKYKKLYELAKIEPQ